MILPKWKANEILSESNSSGLSILDVVLITKQTLKHSKKDSAYLANKVNRKLINYIHLRAERQKAIDIFYKIVYPIKPIKKGIYDFSRFPIKWTWRESNPRPKAYPMYFYYHSQFFLIPPAARKRTSLQLR